MLVPVVQAALVARTTRSVRKTHVHLVVRGHRRHVASPKEISSILTPSQVVFGITGWDLRAKEKIAHEAATIGERLVKRLVIPGSVNVRVILVIWCVVRSFRAMTAIVPP